MKKGFTLFNDSLDILDELTDEQAGQLFKTIRDFNRGQEKTIDPLIKMCFLPFKNQFLRDGIGKTPMEISEINTKNRKLRKFTKSNESNESNESQHLISSVSKSSIKIKVSSTVEDPLKIAFEEFRKLYPGEKRGLEVELQGFIKHHSDWKEIVPKLLPALQEQIKTKEINHKNGAFVATWKHLKTYLYNSSWEALIPLEQPKAGNKNEIQFDEKGNIIKP